MLKAKTNLKFLSKGTSLQIQPCGNLPLLLKKHNKNSKIVIINLQATRLDKHSDLVINYKLDYVFQLIIEELNFKVESPNKIILNSIHSENEKFLLNTKNIIINIDAKKCCYKVDSEPNLILVFTGKRKSGKDYSCNRLIEKLNSLNKIPIIETLTLSHPLKKLYAQEYNINFEKLLDSSQFKEKYRKDMIKLVSLI